MWVDWMIVTNNQIIPQTFILINFVGAVDVKKKAVLIMASARIWADFIRAPPQIKKKKFNLSVKLLLLMP